MKIKNEKTQNKIVIIVILSIIMLFSLLNVANYATNATNETNKTNTQNSSNTAINKNTTNNINNSKNSNTSNSTTNKNTVDNTSKTTNTTKVTTEKSSNANLSNLGIKPHDFKGFNAEITSYEVVIPEDVETVEVYAKAQHAKATVEGTGKKNLQKGENKVEVTVTAEDGTEKTYTITIICGTEQGEYVNTEGLAELKINNATLSPEFKTSVYEYNAKYIGEDTKLNIETKPTNENYIVEVTGNEDLQEGENIITILVSEKNGDNVATYQITLTKSLIDEEAIAREEAEKKKQQQKTIIGIIVAIVSLIIISLIIIKYRKNRKKAGEFSGSSLYKNKEQEEKKQEEKQEEKEIVNNSQQEDEIENMPKEKYKGKRFKEM